jgi:hypothetical protein
MKKWDFISNIIFIVVLVFGMLWLGYTEGFRITGFALPDIGGGGGGDDNCPCQVLGIDIEKYECAPNPPFYCDYNPDDGCSLVKNCVECGCFEGGECNEDVGTCNAPTGTCDDGTEYGSCTEEQPMYCSYNREIEENCDKCGCPSGQICMGDGGCQVLPDPDEDGGEEKDIDAIIELLETSIELRQQRPESIEYADYVFDFEDYEMPFAKLMAPQFRKAAFELPEEKPELLMEDLTKEDIFDEIVEINESLENITEILKSPEIPEKAISISGIKAELAKPRQGIDLSPLKKQRDFQILLAIINQKPQISLDFDGMP